MNYPVTDFVKYAHGMFRRIGDIMEIYSLYDRAILPKPYKADQEWYKKNNQLPAIMPSEFSQFKTRTLVKIEGWSSMCL